MLCEVFYTLIEYGKTTMFLWMFIEGIILYHMTTVAYSRGPEHQTLFYLCGWREYLSIHRKKQNHDQVYINTCLEDTLFHLIHNHHIQN